MKNQQQQIAIYMGLGALITIILLLVMGRLRTERYEAATEQELLDFLEEVENSPTATEDVPENMGPAPMGEGDDSDEED